MAYLWFICQRYPRLIVMALISNCSFRLVTFSSRTTLETLLEQLRNNMRRFPADVDMVYECARRVGGKNSGHVGKSCISALAAPWEVAKCY